MLDSIRASDTEEAVWQPARCWRGRDCTATKAATAKGWICDDGNVSDGVAPDLVTRQRDKLAANEDSRCRVLTDDTASVLPLNLGASGPQLSDRGIVVLRE